MLRRDPREATGYWLQLTVAIGIATLGLVLGSTAVIIGAMLIAPLMGPILSFGMGLAVGSPFLVLRSGARIAGSVALAVGMSALLTRLLPFHELTAEIASRTSPTVLDLVTAAFCAIAGVYASIRPSSDVASTAAGTSIGISLVPPLCASGYGLGTMTWSVAGGAALLFLTNFVAIIFVGTLSFGAAGFNQVQVQSLEKAEIAEVDQTGISRLLANLFVSRGGPWFRVLMPLVLLIAVYVPLRQGLDEVGWQIRARAAVSELVAEVPAQVVQSRAHVERGQVDISLVVLGSTADAEGARTFLDGQLRTTLGVAPHLEVVAVPDANALAGLEAALRAPAPVALRPSPAAELETARRRVFDAVTRRWPKGSAGDPLSVSLETASSEAFQVRVVHLGDELGPTAKETLERILSEDLEHPVGLVDVAIPAGPLESEDANLSFLLKVATILDAVREVPSIAVCATQPEEKPAPSNGRTASRKAAPPPDEPFRGPILTLLQAYPKTVLTRGARWQVSLTRGACATPPTTPEPAGAP